MTPTLTASDKRRLTRLANEYRNEGYRVVVHPSPEDLPEFLRGFLPALVAFSNDENVVLEMRTREQLSDPLNSLVDLASAVEQQPNWRLDLVSTGSKYVEGEVPPGDEPQPHEIRSRIGLARELASEGRAEDAALLAAAAAEATLRRIAKNHEVELSHLQPGFVLRQLYIVGLLGDEHYDVLRHGFAERRMISHGFQPKTSTDDWVQPLIDATHDLLMMAGI